MDKKAKAAWFVLLISAGTDAIIASGGVLMAASGQPASAHGKVALVAAATGAVAAARTIQQALKSAPNVYIGE